MTKDCVEFCRALDLRNIDVVGFSLGGMIAQQLAFEYPDMVRRMILMGTGPRGGEGMTFTELSTDHVGVFERKLLRDHAAEREPHDVNVSEIERAAKFNTVLCHRCDRRRRFTG